MRTFPVYDLFETVGQVRVRQEGLYLACEAEIRTERSGFLRLYLCRAGVCHRLGLFSWDNGALRCVGRVSFRSLGDDWEDSTFAIQNVPFSPLKTPLDGGFLPQNTLLLQEKGRRFVVVRHENRLPEEILPYFCFLTPVKIDGISCLCFEIDMEGKPVISELIRK